MTVDPETKRKGIEAAVKVGLAVLFLGATASYAWYVLEGLIAWSCVGAGLLAWWVLGPAIAERAANWRIAQLKKAIEANPIEAMQNIYATKQQELQAQSRAITAVDTQYRNVQGLINNLPERLKAKAASYQEIADKLKQGLDQMRKSYNFAAQALQEYKGQIEEAEALWEVACAVNKAIAVSEKAKADVFRDIKQKVAFDTVTTSLNNAFAHLDETIRTNQVATELGSGDEHKALPEAKANVEVIDLGNVKATKVRA